MYFTPRIFETKDGRFRIAKPHIAVFNEKHNASKAKVLITLYHINRNQDIKGLRLKDIHKLSGVDYYYVKSQIGKWVKWGYLKRILSAEYEMPLYIYSIAERGIHIVQDIIPKDWLQVYINEIREYRANNQN